MYSELRTISQEQWKTLIAAQLGWTLDAMDVMFYAFALSTIQKEFSLSSSQAGLLASVALIASAIGGIAFGVLADRMGRARSLMFSILLYSIFTSLTATAGSLWELVLWRALVGLGMGANRAGIIARTPGAKLVAVCDKIEERAKGVSQELGCANDA